MDFGANAIFLIICFIINGQLKCSFAKFNKAFPNQNRTHSIFFCTYVLTIRLHFAVVVVCYYLGIFQLETITVAVKIH
jgi:hypothetical protein